MKKRFVDKTKILKTNETMSAVDFHSSFPPGQIRTIIGKPLNSRTIPLAYSPGVGEIVKIIQNDPTRANALTSKQNTVAVITNGTAVLGYGDTGPLAAKPVMEGKAAFLITAGMNAFDIEINQKDPIKLAQTITEISTGFGGIIIEDVAAPGCFITEDLVAKALDIPVMHDDQHGTAIVICAAVLRWLEKIKRSIQTIKLVCVGAGAAGIATLKLLLRIGLEKKNIKLFDSKGLVDSSTTSPYKSEFKSEGGDLKTELEGADILLGLSVANCIDPAFVDKMAPNPLVMLLSNPDPEINPKLIKREDILLCTGRGDFPNQINNVICFPYIMRVATAYSLRIDDHIKIATINALVRYIKLFHPDLILPIASDPGLRYILPILIAEEAKLDKISEFASLICAYIESEYANLEGKKLDFLSSKLDGDKF